MQFFCRPALICIARPRPSVQQVTNAWRATAAPTARTHQDADRIALLTLSRTTTVVTISSKQIRHFSSTDTQFTTTVALSPYLIASKIRSLAVGSVFVAPHKAK